MQMKFSDCGDKLTLFDTKKNELYFVNTEDKENLKRIPHIMGEPIKARNVIESGKYEKEYLSSIKFSHDL
jgi:hypothetical protein